MGAQRGLCGAGRRILPGLQMCEYSTVPGYSHMFSLEQARRNQPSTLGTGAPTHIRTDRVILTVTFHPLVDKPVQKRSTVVTEGRAAIRVHLKLVLASGVLENKT